VSRQESVGRRLVHVLASAVFGLAAIGDTPVEQVEIYVVDKERVAVHSLVLDNLVVEGIAELEDRPVVAGLAIQVEEVVPSLEEAEEEKQLEAGMLLELDKFVQEGQDNHQQLVVGSEISQNSLYVF